MQQVLLCSPFLTETVITPTASLNHISDYRAIP